MLIDSKARVTLQSLYMAIAAETYDLKRKLQDLKKLSDELPGYL